MKIEFDRRQVTGGIVAVSSGLIGVRRAVADEDNQSNKMPGVTPPEDLMREHGVLNRVLLIYEATIQKLANNESFDTSIISQSAEIIRTFIEQYHERNEENQIFPRFRKAGQMTELVNILYQQHQAGRRLTDTIIGLTSNGSTADGQRQQLVRSMQSFILMYRPHESREDTVLFPALRRVVSSNEFYSIAEDFEKDERQKFGEDGFETAVNKVTEIEKVLGINDLTKFTAG